MSRTVWFLVGNGGMACKNYHKGPQSREYHRDPFPHALLHEPDREGTSGMVADA